MKLHGPSLSIRTRGNDVQRLHCQLERLGSNLQPGEIEERLFGKDTETAVKDFQCERELRPMGKADAQSLRLIEEATEALPPRAHVVRG